MRQPPHEFRGKRWIYVASALVFGGLAAFSMVMGPLFLTGAMKAADGRPATDAGIALSIFGLAFSVVAALSLFQVLARRQPLLRIRREGIIVNRIATSPLDDFPSIPGIGKLVALVRIAWLFVSLQGFQQHLVNAPWETFQDAQVWGLAMQRKLTIFSLFFRQVTGASEPQCIGDQLVFEEVAFVVPLDEIARSLTIYAADEAAQQQLPSWER